MINAKYRTEDVRIFKHKFINDPVYGSIGLSKLETDLINTPAFQRLRHLKQLGFASYVFPGGEHSRFVHSLGVLYIMGRMCEQLEVNDEFNEQKDRLFSRDDTVVLRIAALLHDIGHYPLSHLGESVYCYDANKKTQKKEDDFDQLFESEQNLDSQNKKPLETDPLLFDMSKPLGKKIAHHEKLGLIVLTHNKEISDILNSANIDPAIIGDIFTRSAHSPQNMLYYNMLHSSLDADRLDYLLRDSAQTGVKFGMVDLDYLIRLMMVKKIPYKNNTYARIIVYNKKGQHVIEHFLMCRYFHYAQVVTHRTSSAFEMIAKVIFYKMLKEQSFYIYSYEQLFNPINKDTDEWLVNCPEFLQFTDNEWWHSAAEHYKNTNDNIYKLFFCSLINRIPPKSIYFTRDILSYSRNIAFTSDINEQYFIRKRNVQKKLPYIAQTLGLDKERIGCCFGKSDIEKDAHKVKSEELDIDDDDMMDCIKVCDPSSDPNRFTLLAKDETSMVAQIADLYTESMNIFYVLPKDELFNKDDIGIRLREILFEL